MGVLAGAALALEEPLGLALGVEVGAITVPEGESFAGHGDWRGETEGGDRAQLQGGSA